MMGCTFQSCPRLHVCATKHHLSAVTMICLIDPCRQGAACKQVCTRQHHANRALASTTLTNVLQVVIASLYVLSHLLNGTGAGFKIHDVKAESHELATVGQLVWHHSQQLPIQALKPRSQPCQEGSLCCS